MGATSKGCAREEDVKGVIKSAKGHAHDEDADQEQPPTTRPRDVKRAHREGAQGHGDDHAAVIALEGNPPKGDAHERTDEVHAQDDAGRGRERWNFSAILDSNGP